MAERDEIYVGPSELGRFLDACREVNWVPSCDPWGWQVRDLPGGDDFARDFAREHRK